LEDVQRFVAIKRLHESGGLPLVESAARAASGIGDGWQAQQPSDRTTKVDTFWAGLINALPEILIVIDDAGKIVAANETARAKLNIRQGLSFLQLAPRGWRRTFRSIRSNATAGRDSTTLAMRGRHGIVFMNARVVPLGGPASDGRAVLIGTEVMDESSSWPESKNQEVD
jgi:PAS domain-containing protein